MNNIKNRWSQPPPQPYPIAITDTAVVVVAITTTQMKFYYKTDVQPTYNEPKGFSHKLSFTKIARNRKEFRVQNVVIVYDFINQFNKIIAHYFRNS